MKFKPDKAKPLSRETRHKGQEFVRALLNEGHDYDSVKANFLSIVARTTLEIAHEKVISAGGKKEAIVGGVRQGYAAGAMREAARMLGVNRNRVSALYHGVAV